MDNKSLKTLEFDKIAERLAEFARNDSAKDKALSLTPSSDFRIVEQTIEETDSAVQLMIKYGSPDIVYINDITESAKRLSAGGGLSMSELLNIARILKGARIMKQYTEEQTGTLSGYISELVSAKPLEDRIFTSIISEDEMSDTASTELANIRRKIKNSSSKVRDTLDNMIHSQHYRKFLQDPIITVRNNRYVVPVKAEHRTDVKGIVHDMSSSGSTVFIEPEAVVNANNDLHELEIKERAEIERILLELSALAASVTEDLTLDFDILTHLDFVFAKAKLALDMKAVKPILNKEGYIHIHKGRHPLIDRQKVVPVDIDLGKDFDTLIVTGPNTGGKTVVLKTLGLFCLMAQAGLHLPAGDTTEVSVCPDIFADIGDEQSIEQSLSTFSSHMKKIVAISDKITEGCLVLFDELGAGTDPTEGAALATAIIENFRLAGAKIAATTHYSELKLYALSTERVENASCEFDVTTLSPTYRLLIGVPGKSNAFAISEKLGLSDRIIDRAKDMLSQENIKFEDVLSKIEDNRLSAEKNFAEAERLRKETERLKAELAAERDKIERQKDKIYDKAREKAEKIILRTQADIDKKLEDIQTAQKERDEKEALRQMQELKRDLGLKLKKNKSRPQKSENKLKGNVNLNTLKLGATVMLNDIGDKGSVLSINKKDGCAVVQVGIMKITAKAENMTLLSDEAGKRPEGYTSTRKSASSVLRRDSVKSEIDLRGMVLEEAEVAVDKFLDECSMADLSTVSIIHGKGTGILRQGIQTMLRKHPHVKSFRLGRYGEGENGVTIAELK